jgi:hypothetical protein
LAHAIFDVESAIASLDLKDGASTDQVQEVRADAFAQEVLVPLEVLRHVGQQIGIKWRSMDAPGVASLVAATHVEQRTLIKALRDAQLIDGDCALALDQLDIASDLHDLTEHALSTEEYMIEHPEKKHAITRRSTSTAPRKLLLPTKYVDAVLKAVESRTISRGKAATMLLIDRDEFEERFPQDEAALAE